MNNGDKKLTIIDVAKLAKVSITTVSRIINDQGAKKETKEKVLSIIERYEYYPNPYARYLGKRSRLKSIKKRKRFR